MKECACALIVLATLVFSGAASAQTSAPSDSTLALPEADPPIIEPRTDTEPPAPTRPEDAPLIPSFQRRSAQQAGGNANELNTSDERAREKLPGGSVSETLSARDLYHGNYCGHGNRGQGAEPTDELDAACKRHDECYDTAGRRSCACDVALQREALALANTARLSRELRGRAASVLQAAQLMSCEKP